MSIRVGTTGIGLYYNRVLNSPKRLVARFGGQYIAYRKEVRVKTAPDSYIVIAPDFTIGFAEASLKWYPLTHGSFFVTAGAGYTWHPAMNFVITATNKLNLGGLELTPDDVGTVDLGFRWQSVVGYAGWGFGQMMPGKRLNIGFEMGVYYLGRPRVQLAYEGFLETTNIDEQVPIVERNLSNYRYLPSVNITLSYALNRSH
ncbi:hypothetical protein [Spirosoma agri]|uniref:Outer membrane protein beta-barrel domain-containing protein n=1 Tax=Spirosoma agri TaxID=1987381 RepID=A0A6M0IN31_9BACT|nr:hypothetical protein [Spirosoma agri]NEU69337.1 hypothetical protein [Spirosoma agri]